MRLKSGVQLNFIERRVRADRALSQLVRMTRETTEALSSREQRGFYRLESIAIQAPNPPLSRVDVWIRTVFAARWMTFSAIVIAFVRGLWARVCADARRALGWVRVVWACAVAPKLVTFRAWSANGIVRIRKLHARMRSPRMIARE